MLDTKIEKACEQLINMYAEIETDLLKLIAKHFNINEEFINSDVWRFQKLSEMGLLNEEVVDYLAKATNRTKEEILKALKQVGVDTIDISKLKGLYKDGKFKINPSIFEKNLTINSMIQTSYIELEKVFTQLSPKVIQATRSAYINVVDKAYLKVVMGTESYQTAIKQALTDLGDKGIKILTYQTVDENGNVMGIRNYDVVGTVRRETLNSARHLSNNINEQVIKDLDVEYVYLSEHYDCRPTHFPWQGTVIKYSDLVAVTDYGSVTGLGGINCRHYFEPYFGDNKDTKKITQNEADRIYDLKQRQRQMERTVRAWKHKEQIYKEADMKDEQKLAKKKVIAWSNAIDRYCTTYNLQREYARERI